MDVKNRIVKLSVISSSSFLSFPFFFDTFNFFALVNLKICLANSKMQNKLQRNLRVLHHLICNLYRLTRDQINNGEKSRVEEEVTV